MIFHRSRFILIAIVSLTSSCSNIKIQKEYWENKTIKSEYSYRHNVKDGIQKDYDELGNLKKEYHYKQGNIEGLFIEYYPNKVKKYTVSYSNGKMNGKAFSFYDTGELNQIEEFKNDTLIGPVTNYFKSGVVRFKCQYCSVKCIGEIDSLQTTIKTSDCDFVSLVSVWCGEFTAYSENGNVVANGNYYPGYHIIKTIYEDGVGTAVAPIRNGVWKFYDVNGNIEDEKTYKMGIVIK